MMRFTKRSTVQNFLIVDSLENIYSCLALIELDSKSAPQEKIRSIMECKSFTEDAIRASSSSSGINADSFLPALIFIVLKAKPPRLHSNIQFLSHFSQPSGEQLYYLANLVCQFQEKSIYMFFVFVGFCCEIY